MVHGKNRIPYWIDRRLTGLAGPDDDATISFGLPIEPEDSQYGECRIQCLCWCDLLTTLSLRGRIPHTSSPAGCVAATNDVWRLDHIPRRTKHRMSTLVLTATLTSLAILKVNLEERRGDYLENLRPFIVQVLVTHSPNPVTDNIVAEHIREDFGLVIPRRTIQRLLRRLVNAPDVNVAERSSKIQIIGSLEDPALADKQRAVESDIQAILDGLQEFSKTTSKPITQFSEAVAAITTFLGRFDITCLSAYERGTAIPRLGSIHPKDIVLTSDYVQHLQETDKDMFERFIVLVKGHMLANALMCPDLEDAPESYEGVTFYLDTPLLVHWLGLESEQEETAARALVDLVKVLGGNFSVFTHTLDELEGIIMGAADQVAGNNPLTPIAYESIRRGMTATELRLAVDQMEGNLQSSGIVAELTPLYNPEFQINEELFGEILDRKNVSYWSERARSHDINSVRSIYEVRRDRPARTLESSHAVLVTTNSGFAGAAWAFGREHLASRHVSTVISDFSLANTAWLKTPVDSIDVPITQILAFSYAALRPPEGLWQKYLTEIDKLQEKGTISQEQHALLRSRELAGRELVHLTLGEDAAIKQETLKQTVDRVTGKVTKEADKKLRTEQEKHKTTLEAFRSTLDRNQTTKEKVRQWCRRAAGVIAYAMSVLIVIALLSGVIGGLRLSSTAPVIGLIISMGSGLVTFGSLLNLVVGTNVRGLHFWVRDKISSWLFNFIARAFSIDTCHPNSS